MRCLRSEIGRRAFTDGLGDCDGGGLSLRQLALSLHSGFGLWLER